MADQTPSNDGRAARLARRAALAADVGARLGVDEDSLLRLVEEFYARARADALLGPVFAAKVKDWPDHHSRIRDFWSSVMLASGRYGGRPMAAHAILDIDGRHFDRWLALFEETARDLFEPHAADALVWRARRIAQTLELGIATTRGIMLEPAERLRP